MHQNLAIVGMRRSGTSSICLALNRLGVSFGASTQLHHGDEFNAEGYWEHKSLIGIHRTFRMSLNLTSVDCDPIPPDWRQLPSSEVFLARGARCLEEQFLKISGPWAWKDPDASLALPFVYEIAKRVGVLPHLLICVRNPVDVAQSEKRRRGSPELETIGAWLAHTLNALHDSRNFPRTVISFSSFLEDPCRALSPTVAAIELDPSEEEWEKSVASVRRDLVHSNSSDDALDAYPALVHRVYSLCLLAASDPHAVIEDEIEACYREFESYRQMFWRPALEEATVGAMWERRQESQYAQVPYRPSQTWQTVYLEMGALPCSPVQLYLYPLPANVWIRKAVWHFGGAEAEAQLEAGRSGNLRQQLGLACVSILHGPDHVLVRTPSAKGPFTLELELLVESNNLVIGETYKVLSDLCRKS